MGKLCFGVDLGGTTVKMGVFTVEGSLLSDWEIPTRKEEKGKYILDDIAESIKAKIEEEAISPESLFARGGMACTLLYGALITGIGLAAFLVLPCGILAGKGELSWNLSDWVEGLRELLSREKILARSQTYAFTVLGMCQLYHAVGMRDMQKSVFAMRPWDNPLMVFGGLESVVRNINHKSQNLKFFEVGNTYLYNKEKWSEESPIKAYSQEAHMSLFITGKRVEGSWAHADEQSNIYELKAVVENILRRVGMPQNNVVIKHSDNNIFSKGVSYETRAGKVLVELGILSLKLKKAFDIEQDVFYADIHWDNLMKAVKKVNLTYTDISKYPSVSRDLALLVDKNVEFAQIEQIAHQTEKKLLKSVVLFDVYEGEHLPEGKKSYAVNFILQDEEKTLNDKQIDAIMKKLIANLTSKLNAELR